MSLLNLTSDGTHSALIVIFKLLLAEKSAIERDKLVALCAPTSLVSDKKMIGNTINRWTQFGLFQIAGEDEKISIHPDVCKDEKELHLLPRLARRVVLHPENNGDLWASEAARAADFTRGITWLLAQDVYLTEWEGWTTAQPVLQRQMPTVDNDEASRVRNDTRWPSLKVWARFLGFGWKNARGRGALILDPTDAIRDALPAVFGRKRTLEACDCMAALAEALPVLDGGTYRNAVEEKLRERSDPDAWQPPPDGHLSTSLSRALLRLSEEGSLTGSLAADFDPHRRVHLTGRRRSTVASFSHFTWSPLL